MPSTPLTRSNAPVQTERYPLGEFPPEVIASIGKQIIHRLAVGNADISGDDFGNIFAEAIDGQHALRPEGIADVTWNGCAWSIKTIKNTNPFNARKVRLISGRTSPTYSFEVGNVLENPRTTGKAVLEIWNKRVKQARYNSDNLRLVVLMRDIENLRFAIFEYESEIFTPDNYIWKLNVRNNLDGFDAVTEEKCFTFQPHGSQFTIHRPVPASAKHFSLHRPGMITVAKILNAVGYKDSWVKIHK